MELRAALSMLLLSVHHKAWPLEQFQAVARVVQEEGDAELKLSREDGCLPRTSLMRFDSLEGVQSSAPLPPGAGL